MIKSTILSQYGKRQSKVATTSGTRFLDNPEIATSVPRIGSSLALKSPKKPENKRFKQNPDGLGEVVPPSLSFLTKLDQSLKSQAKLSESLKTWIEKRVGGEKKRKTE